LIAIDLVTSSNADKTVYSDPLSMNIAVAIESGQKMKGCLVHATESKPPRSFLWRMRNVRIWSKTVPTVEQVLLP
jgi:hypothetical protein